MSFLASDRARSGNSDHSGETLLNKRNNWKKARYSALLTALPLLIVFSLLIAFGVEWMQRDTFDSTMEWIAAKPSIFLLNTLVVFLVMTLAYSLAGSLLLGAGVSFLVIFLASLISYFKLKLRGEPFYPWDIMLNKEGMNIAPFVSQASSLAKLGGIVAIGLALIAASFRLPRWKAPLPARGALAVLAVLMLHAMCMRTPLAWQLYNKAGVQEIVWNQKQNYSDNGTPLAFAMNVRNTVVPKPEGYGEPAIAELANSLKTVRLGGAGTDSDVQPNVIFIMNEAFWDPTLLPNVKFSEDPLPTLHRLQQESVSGWLLSPQFGGGTSNVEYEVLTGNSMSFLPGGSVPYQQYIHKPTPSLASYFEDKGYKSMGIHPYDGWFWSRDRVYKQLGFESFMSKEYFNNPEYKGAFISDAEVSRTIINQVEQTDKPMFIYAVTMQNHGPYDDNRYGDAEIKVEGDLTPEARRILENFTQGVRDADRSLQMLIDHFEQSDEPTIVVMYGDHLPMLGMDYDVYIQGGFVPASTSEWTLEDAKKMYTTPLVMWANFELPKKQFPVISASFLGSNVMDLLGMQMPANFAYNFELSKKLPGLTGSLVADADYNLYSSVPEPYQADVAKYEELQYDSLFGQRYLANYIDTDYLTKAALPHYNEEFESAAADQQTEIPPAES